MAELIDALFFKELAEQNPDEVCKRALCRYDGSKKRYRLTVWEEEYEICPHGGKIDRISQKFSPPHTYLYLFIIHYLLTSKMTGLCHEWVSEKDIPGGAAFFRGPHEIATHLISSRYKGDIRAFETTCERFGGVPLDMADAAYVFKITPRIPAAVLYWDGDEEFPPESRILYDQSISEHLALDIIFALAMGICTRIGGATAPP